MVDMYNNNWNIGLSVSYPLSALYKNNHKIKESKLAVALSQNTEEQKIQQIRVNWQWAMVLCMATFVEL
jgi:outer membrane protein TolC